MIFLSGRAPLLVLTRILSCLFAASLNLVASRPKSGRTMGSQVSSVALLHHQVTRVNMLTGQLLSLSGGLPYLTSCIGAENDGDDWPVHVLCLLAHEKISKPRSLTHFLASLFTTRSYLLSFSACLLHRYPFSLCLFLHLLSKKFSSLFLPSLSFVNLSTATQQRTSSHGLEDTQQIHHSRFWRRLRVCRSTRCCSCQSNHQGHARREKPVRRSQRGPLCLPRDEVG